MARKAVDNWFSLAEYDLAAVLTEERAAEILSLTKELFAWIKSKL
jgi:hypothetical protein